MTPSGNKASKKILVVEDDKHIYNAISTLLNHYGYEVTLAHTVAEGKKMLLGNPDMVVLDAGLPDGDGLDVLKVIRSTGLKARVAVLTARTDDEHQRAIQRLKPDRYFRKPMNFIELLQALRAGLTTEAVKAA